MEPLQVYFYSSSHYCSHRGLAKETEKHLKDVPLLEVVIRAAGGKKLDEEILEFFEYDAKQSKGKGIFLLLLGDNNLRAPEFDRTIFLNFYRKLFELSDKLIPNGTLIINGILPNPNKTGYDQQAKMIDEEIKNMSYQHERVETVSLREQAFKIMGIAPENLYLKDQVHLNKRAEEQMGSLMAAQCKAAVCFQRMNLSPKHFSMFEIKSSFGSFGSRSFSQPRSSNHHHPRVQNAGWATLNVNKSQIKTTGHEDETSSRNN